jgi:hypothetical protein
MKQLLLGFLGLALTLFAGWLMVVGVRLIRWQWRQRAILGGIEEIKKQYQEFQRR